jgi:hypothetical protein
VLEVKTEYIRHGGIITGTLVAKVGGSQVQQQPGLYNKILISKKKKDTKNEK